MAAAASCRVNVSIEADLLNDALANALEIQDYDKKEPSYIVITGIITELRQKDAYVNPLEGSSEQNIAGGLAVLQSLSGVAGTVGSSQLASYDGDPVKAFEMKVNDQAIIGYFWSVEFKGGDYVQVVGHLQDGIFYAVAVTMPNFRVMWMRPHFIRGTKAFFKSEWIRISFMVLCLDVIFSIICIIAIALGSYNHPERIVKALLMILVPGSLLCGLILRTPKFLARFNLNVNAIAKALGIKDPEFFDLEKRDKLARKSGKPRLKSGKYY